jgi:tetratricopeptide (TPR) repeat protein
VDEAFRILGRTQVRMAGRFENRRSRHWLILGALLAQPGRLLPLDTLVDWVWPEDEERPQNTQQTFHTYANRIRSLLRKLDVGAQLIGQRGALRLIVDRKLIDYHRFRDAMDEARKFKDNGDVRRARDLAAAAMELWTGPPLAELETARAANWRHNVMVNQWVPANVLLIELHLALGEADQAIARLDDVQDEYPTHIALAKQRIRALWQLDRRPDATDYYLSWRRGLLADSEDDAAEDLRQFHDDVRRGAERARTGRTPVAQRSEEDGRPAVLGLPHAVPDFIGRERLLARIDEAAVGSDDRLRAAVICLDGMSGVGKTALATYWSRRRHEEHGDGAVFVDLHGFSSGQTTGPDAAVDELLHLLGFPVNRIDTAEGRATKLRELLSRRRTIVLLDNVHDSDSVLPLLRLLSDSLVLITTRQRLTRLEVGHGARSLTVHPLSTDHAVELIANRVGDRAEQDRDSVARLAELCEGLPLVLTLVAHHIAPHRDVPLTAFVERFRDPEVLLALGDEGDGANISIKMAFATSYRDLRDPERRIFRLLGLHPGPDISLPAAAALVGLPVEECRRGLATLVSAHLLEQRGALDRSRFHDLLRVYAASLATAEEPETARSDAARRMLDFYVHSAHRADRKVFAHRNGIPMPPVPDDITPMTFPDARTGAEWCLTERANLVAAVAYAAEHHFSEHSWRFPHVIAGIFKRYGFRQDIRDALEKGLAGARRTGNTEAEGATVNDLGLLALELGDFEAARRHFHLAAYLAQTTRSAQGVATSICNMARLDIIDGNINSGIDHYQNAIRMATETGNTHLRAAATRSLADVYRDRRQYETAVTFYYSALRMHESIMHRDGQVEAMVGLSTTYLMRGMRDDYAVAKEYARQAIERIPPVTDLRLEQRARVALAEALLRLGELDEAVAQAMRAVGLARQSHAAYQEAKSLDLYARALRAAGHRTEAVEAWRQCAAIHRDRGDARLLALAQSRLAEMAASTDDLPAGRDGTEPVTRPVRRY